MTFISPPSPAAEWIAVQATGESMVPAGIFEGNIVYCDPGQIPASGETVFVKRVDQAASIKVFVETTPDGWTILRGWMPPGKEGRQKPYEDKLAPGQVAVIAPVIYVRRRI